ARPCRPDSSREAGSRAGSRDWGRFRCTWPEDSTSTMLNQRNYQRLHGYILCAAKRHFTRNQTLTVSGRKKLRLSGAKPAHKNGFGQGNTGFLHRSLPLSTESDERSVANIFLAGARGHTGLADLRAAAPNGDRGERGRLGLLAGSPVDSRRDGLSVLFRRSNRGVAASVQPLSLGLDQIG